MYVLDFKTYMSVLNRSHILWVLLSLLSVTGQVSLSHQFSSSPFPLARTSSGNYIYIDDIIVPNCEYPGPGHNFFLMTRARVYTEPMLS